MTDEIIIYNIMIENDCNNKNEISIIKEIEPLRILGLKKISKYGLLFRVEWKERVDGIKPANSIIENKVACRMSTLLFKHSLRESSAPIIVSDSITSSDAVLHCLH